MKLSLYILLSLCTLSCVSATLESMNSICVPVRSLDHSGIVAWNVLGDYAYRYEKRHEYCVTKVTQNLSSDALFSGNETYMNVDSCTGTSSPLPTYLNRTNYTCVAGNSLQFSWVNSKSKEEQTIYINNKTHVFKANEDVHISAVNNMFCINGKKYDYAKGKDGKLVHGAKGRCDGTVFLPNATDAPLVEKDSICIPRYNGSASWIDTGARSYSYDGSVYSWNDTTAIQEVSFDSSGDISSTYTSDQIVTEPTKSNDLPMHDGYVCFPGKSGLMTWKGEHGKAHTVYINGYALHFHKDDEAMIYKTGDYYYVNGNDKEYIPGHDIHHHTGGNTGTHSTPASLLMYGLLLSLCIYLF